MIFVVVLLVFQSCFMNSKTTVPSYTNDSTHTEQLVTHQPIPMPGDTTRNIIVYNVVENNDKKGLSDETWRSFIAQFFSTISTIFAFIYGTNTEQ